MQLENGRLLCRDDSVGEEEVWYVLSVRDSAHHGEPNFALVEVRGRNTWSRQAIGANSCQVVIDFEFH